MTEKLFTNSESSRGTRKLEGVFFRGYGVVPKSIITNNNFSPEARLIYAYFCTREHNRGGWQDAPKEEAILRDLSISHAPYLRHRSQLIQSGLIRFRQLIKDDGGVQSFSTNQFLLPKNIDSEIQLDKEISQQGIYNGGYGLLPSAVVLDKSLSRNAKMLYVLLCVYAPASLTADAIADHPDLAITKIAKNYMSLQRLVDARHELESAGYLKTVDRRPRGLMYVLKLYTSGNGTDTTDIPEIDTTDIPEIDTTDIPEIDTTDIPEIDTTDIPEIDMPEIDMPEIDTTYIIHKKRITEKRNTSFVRARERLSGPIEDSISSDSMVDNGQASMIDLIRGQIGACYLEQSEGKEVVHAVIATMADVYSTPDKYSLKIDGIPKQAATVKEIFRKIDIDVVEHCLNQINNHHPLGEEVASPKAYLRTALYNAVVGTGFDMILLGK